MGKTLIGVLMFLLGGITTATVSAQSGITGVIWQLTELNGKRVSDSEAYIEFDEDEMRAGGNAGCNRFFGRYELSGRDIRVHGIGSTRMACMQREAMATEREFLKALAEVTKLRQNGINLSVFNDERRLMRFKAMNTESEASAEITGQKWILRSIHGTAVSLDKDEPFLNFDSEKKSAGGNTGCNVFGGSFEIDGSSIKFSNMISTMRACEFEDRMTVERGFLNGLQNGDRFEIRGKKLTIFMGSEMLLEFEGIAK